MPIPLAMMIPFMATQSMVMGDAFGQAFQYGKRKISAMTNDEFNKTTMEQLASEMFKAYQNIIPDLKQSIEQSRSLQALIVSELIKLPTSIFQEVTGTGTSPETIRKSATTSEVNAPFASDPWEGWNNFWNSQAKAVSFLTVPSAHADTTGTGHIHEGTGTTTQTFTQAQQDIQDKPPSNVPLTLSILTDAEFNQAYSQRNNGSYTTKQIQQFNLEKAKRKDRTPETFKAIPDPENPAILLYHKKRTEGLMIINHTKINIARLELSGHVDAPRLIIQKKAKLARAKKSLMNVITLARNVTSTKSIANNDWNKRIWNL